MAMPTARATHEPSRKRLGLSVGIAIARECLRNWWRKQSRSPYIGDLRLIRREYRHLYRHKFQTGCCGDAICGLLWAYDAKHLRSQQSGSVA